MNRKTSSYREALLEALSDPTEAALYLTAAMEDSPEMFRKALRNVAQSRQIAKVAKNAGVTRESLYRATSEIGNPTLDTLYSVLEVLGIKLAFVAESVEALRSPVEVLAVTAVEPAKALPVNSFVEFASGAYVLNAGGSSGTLPSVSFESLGVSGALSQLPFQQAEGEKDLIARCQPWQSAVRDEPNVSFNLKNEGTCK
jgi:probable addiction module antidote protein